MPQPGEASPPREATSYVRRARTRCPYCHAGLEPSQAATVCASCLAPHHEGCWNEAGRCSTCSAGDALIRPGASSARAPARPVAVETPKWWSALLRFDVATPVALVVLLFVFAYAFHMQFARS